MKHILQMSFFATSGMTLFSFILSRVFKEKFLETKLLNQLVFPDEKEKNKNHPAGFVLHYAVGTFFSALYSGIWKKTALRPGVSTGSVLGLLNGLLGISGWHIFFLLHPIPPVVNRRRYYLQLSLAHVVFGFLNGLMFKNIQEPKD